MDQAIIDAYITLFGTLKRKGPGSDETTARAISLLPELPENPKILDVGCGAGAQTLVLAEQIPGATIDAVDISRTFLDELRRDAVRRGVSSRVATAEASMDALPFPDNHFDLIWSEGAIYIVGFLEGLKLWRSLLKDGGLIAVSEVSWIKKNPPYAVASYWERNYPGISDIEGNIKRAESAGYEVLKNFVLPSTDWWENCYEPLEKRIGQLQGNTNGNEALESVIATMREEFQIFHKFGEYYSYVFYLMRKA